MQGETLCEMLKVIYFKDIHWSDCYKLVAKKFTDLKQIAKKFYTDKDDLAILRELNKYSTKDIQDMFHMEPEFINKDANNAKPYTDRLSTTLETL